jgi:hypothetical protein
MVGTAEMDRPRTWPTLGTPVDTATDLDQRSDQQCRLIEVVQGLAAALHPSV